MDSLAPGSPELELAFIASALLSTPEDGEQVARMVDAECFTHPRWAKCWTAIGKAWARGDMADPVTVAIEAADGDPVRLQMALLQAVVEDINGSWHLQTRAERLVELKTRRELMAFGAETAREANRTDDLRGLSAYITRYGEVLDDLRAREETGELAPIADAVEAEAESGAAVGWPTGLPHYDEWSAGLRRGEVHIIAGGSGIGKTWVLSQVATKLAIDGLPVALFSLEMTRKSMYVRLMASRIGTMAYRLMGRGREWTADEYRYYESERDRLTASGLRLFTDQRSLSDITAVTRTLRPAAIMVDYIQLMDAPAGCKAGYEAATENARGLQRLAQRADCCVVIASQMSRESLRAGTGSAVLGAEGSGRIDHVADVWLEVRKGDRPGLVELHARKVRSGPTGESAVYRLDKDSGRLVPVGS